MKLLIVDDEQQIRDSMTRYIESQPLGFTEIRTASGGVEALRIADDFKPDLLIVDILMPGIDGIETIERLHERYADMQSIIISGCNDFQYVKSALRFPVEDYLLKPIHLPELNAALHRARKKIQEIHQNRHMAQRIEWLNESMPDLRERFVSALLTGRYSDGDSVKSTLHMLELEGVFAPPLIVSVVSLRNDKAELARDALDLVSLRRILPKYIEDEYLVWVDDQHMAAIAGALKPAQTAGKYEKALNRLESEQGISAVAGVSYAAKDVLDLGNAFRQAINAMQLAKLSAARVMTAQDTQISEEEETFHISIKGDALWMLKRCILEGDLTAMREVVEHFFVDFEGHLGLGANLWHIKLEVLRVYAKLLMDLGGKMPANMLVGISNMEHLGELHMIKEWLLGQLTLLLKSNHAQRRSRAESIAQWMTREIHSRYPEPLSLQTFADESNLSVNYLSQVFNENIGQSFIHYLTNCRLNHATKLFKDMRIPISQIGVMVGYENPNYFARLFRKQYGMSPSEYREKYAL